VGQARSLCRNPPAVPAGTQKMRCVALQRVAGYAKKR
jgi:hypothetical protein